MESDKEINKLLGATPEQNERTFEGEMGSLAPRTSSFMRFERFRRFFPVGVAEVV